MIRSSRWLSERFRSIGAFLAAAAIIGACNDITAPGEDAQPTQSSAVSTAETTPPTVAVLTPANGATGVATNVRVVIQFSETMDLSTINSSTFTVSPSGGPPVPGVIMFHGLNRVSWDPSPALGNNVTYTVRVSTGAKDVSGNALVSDFTSTFTTVVSVADATPPTVVGSSPVSGASNVPVNTSVTATFSETMDASTVGASSVSLAPTSGGPAIAANVTFDGPSKVVTLAPTSPLAYGVSYTLTISTAVKDPSGNAMAAPFTAAFTTAPAPDVTSPTVTNVTPVNSATGVGVGSSVIVTFSEAMNAGTIGTSTFSLTPTSGGSPVAASVTYNAGPRTATLVPSSPLAGNTGYTVNVTSGAKDLANNGLVPFSSTFTTAAPSGDVTPPTVAILTPANGATGQAVDLRLVIQFSETMNLNTINSSTFTVTPAGGSPIPGVILTHGLNIVSFDPSPVMAGGTTYTIRVTTGAKDVAGNGLASDATSTFTTVGAADNTPPTVTAVTPVNGATSVALNASATVTFSEPMNAGSVSGTTFTLTPAGGSPIAATVSYNAGAGTATLVPSAALTASTSYTVNVTSGAKDVANNGLTPFSSTFTTAAPVDVTPPTVTNATPVNGAANVSLNSSATVTFSEPMSAASVNGTTFTLTPTAGGSPVAATVSYNAGGGTATLTPSAPLASSTGYTINVTSGAKDVANNGLTPFSSTFTTIAVDGTAPTVTNVTPANSATGIAVGSSVVVTFSEAMSAGTLGASTFTLTPTSGGSPVAANVTYNAGAGTATLAPSSALASNTSYTVNVTSGAKDLANNGLVPFSSTFTTAAPSGDVTPPTVAILTPANGATGQATNKQIVIQFNETMNLSTINSATFTVSPPGGPAISGAINFHGLNRVSFDASPVMAGGVTYTVRVTTGAKDLAGNGVASDFTSTFTTVGAADVTPPTVTNVTPANAATGVAIASNVVVSFSETMNAGTVTGATFTLTPTSGGSPVAASVSYNAGSATLDPTSDLAYGTSYTVNVTNGAKDLANNGLTPFSSTFTTLAAPDVTPPTVTTVSPLNAASAVGVASNVVVTFSEAMNAGTVTGTTFTLTPTSGGSPVAASVSYNAGNGTLDPTSDLAYSTSYTVNVTNGAKDLANNGLTPFSSTFTTAAAPDLTSPAVTNVIPVNAATGVAIGTNVSVTFSEAMNAGTVTGTTFTLTPTSGGSPVAASVSYNAGSATLDPTSDLGYSTSYTVNVTNGAKDLANNGLTPFSSTFTTAAAPDLTSPTVTNVTPVNAATGVAIGTNVAVTFSEAMNAGTVTGTTFALTPTSGGSPVAASVSYNAGSATLDPASDLAYSTSYTVNVTSGARDLANNGLTPFSSTFTTAAAPDLTPPTVTNVTPVNAATGVAIGTNVVVAFSEAMNAGTVTGTTFTLTPTSGGSPVAASVSYNAGSATLDPTTDLAYSTSYTVNVTNGAKDLANNGLTPFSSTFSTAAAPDLTPPTVTNVTPVNAATAVGITTNVVVTFSEAMNAGTVTGTTFTLTPTSGGSPVAASVSYNAGSATLNPTSDLAYSTSYTVNVTNGAKDLANNGLTPFSSTFTTAAPPDVTSPTVTNVSPTNSATNVAIGTTVVVTFSEGMNAGTINGTTFTLSPTAGGGAVAASVSYNAGAGTATLTPSASLAYSTGYTVNVTNGAKDLANNGLTAFSSTFTTLPPPDLTPPTVTGVTPVNGATGVAANADVVVTFSEAMSSGTLTTSTFTLTPTSGGSPVAAVVSYSAGSATLNPSSNLALGTSYTVNVTSGAKDLANNGLTPFSSTFTTVPPDLTAPTVTATSPVTRSYGVSTTTQVRFTFSEPLNPSTITDSTFRLKEEPLGPFVSGSRTYESATNSIVFTPTSPFVNHRSITVTATTGIRDVAGNPLAAAVTSCFTPQSGAGTIISMTGFWAANEGCQDVHFHVPIIQTGNALSLGVCNPEIYCEASAITQAGKTYLGGETCGPSPYGPPRICDVTVVSLSGTVSGSAINFTLTMENGLTFTFNGSFSATGTANPFITGSISGATLPLVGMTFEREAL